MKKNMTVYRFYLSFVPSPKQTNACIVLYSAFKRYLYGNRMLRWPCIATAANIIEKKKIIQEKIKINWENNTRPNKWTDDKKYHTHTHQTKSRAHNREEIKYEFRKAKDEFLKEKFFFSWRLQPLNGIKKIC